MDPSGVPILSKEVDNVEIDALVSNGPQEMLSSSCLPQMSQQARPPMARKKSKKKKAEAGEDGLVAMLCAWVVDHQIGIAVNLLLLLTLTHMCFPRARQYTRKFFTLSYYNPETGRYGYGADDMALVTFWLIVFMGLRIVVMDYLMAPVAQRLEMPKKDKMRFSEQAWVYSYYLAFFSMGMYIMYTSDYWCNFRNLWTNWPDREMSGLFKWYYLAQFAFWLQQIVTLHIEERRKDHVQMFSHHIVTTALMFASYCYHYTKVGNVILCIMDSVDLIFPLAKMLKYMKFQKTCDAAFGVFMLVWFYARHIVYMQVLYSIFVDYFEVTTFGCYRGTASNLEGPLEVPDKFMHLLEPFKDPKGVICQTHVTTYSFVALLVFLQTLLVVWFFMIVRVAARVLRGESADDIRSDDEGEEQEEEDIADHKAIEYQSYIEVPPLEEDVGVEGINLSGRKINPTKMFRRSPGASSGVSLPSDKKELLGRIGCDKGA